MEHIPTTATAIRKIKATAKAIRDQKGITLGAALDEAAQAAGYANFHLVTHCAANSASKTGIGSSNGGVAQRFLCLHIELDDVKPAVWREVFVSNSISLGNLHEVIQAVMGWDDDHLHEFVIDARTYTNNPSMEHELSEDGVTLERALGSKRKFTYLYDYGDSWHHTIKLVSHKMTNADELKTKLAVFIRGENACPPEDVGGNYGYERFLKAIRDPEHRDHQEYMEWCPENFDPARFDVDQIASRLEEVAYLAVRQAELANTKSLQSSGIELPKDAELALIEYLYNGCEDPFTSKDLQEVILSFMEGYYNEIYLSLPHSWARRIVDAFIRREGQAGSIEFIGPGGPMSLWRVVYEHMVV